MPWHIDIILPFKYINNYAGVQYYHKFPIYSILYLLLHIATLIALFYASLLQLKLAYL